MLGLITGSPPNLFPTRNQNERWYAANSIFIRHTWIGSDINCVDAETLFSQISDR